MTIKIPQFCMGHTVRGTCTVGLNSTSDGAKTVTVPEGTYFLDPLSNTYGVALTGDTRLHWVLGNLINAALTSSGAWALNATTPTGFYNLRATYSGGQTADFRFTPSTCNAEGKRLLHALGVNPFGDDPTANPVTGSGVPYTWTGGVAHTWCPGRGDVRFSTDERQQDGMGVTNVGYQGGAWAFDLGRPSRSRVCRFDLLPGYLVERRSTYPMAAFMDVAWPFLSRGEQIRYFADRSSVCNTLSVACTASDSTITMDPNLSTTGLVTAGQEIWVDGEPMRVISNAFEVVKVWRNPELAVDHPVFAPISADFVADYVLDSDSMSRSKNERRDNADFWNLSFSLARVR